MDRTALVNRYREALTKAKSDGQITKVPTYFEAWPGFFDHDPTIVRGYTNCWHIVRPFSGVTYNGKVYQFDLRSHNLGRPIAWRANFLDHPNFDDDGWTVSHLCHNPKCYRPDHHHFEPLEVNKGRNGCPGGPHCHHKQRCLRPGPYYDK